MTLSLRVVRGFQWSFSYACPCLGQPWALFFRLPLPPNPTPRQDFSLHWNLPSRLDWLTNELQGYTWFCLPSTEHYKHVPLCLALKKNKWVLGIELRMFQAVTLPTEDLAVRLFVGFSDEDLSPRSQCGDNCYRLFFLGSQHGPDKAERSHIISLCMLLTEQWRVPHIQGSFRVHSY